MSWTVVVAWSVETMEEARALEAKLPEKDRLIESRISVTAKAVEEQFQRA